MRITRRAFGWIGISSTRVKWRSFSECTLKCAQKSDWHSRHARDAIFLVVRPAGQGRRQLTRRPSPFVGGTVLLDPLNHPIQFGIAGAKAPREPVSSAPSNALAVGDHFKLTSLARYNHGSNAEALLYEGHETRDLGLVVLSGRAGNYLDLHSPFSSLLGVLVQTLAGPQIGSATGLIVTYLASATTSSQFLRGCRDDSDNITGNR